MTKLKLKCSPFAARTQFHQWRKPDVFFFLRRVTLKQAGIFFPSWRLKSIAVKIRASGQRSDRPSLAHPGQWPSAPALGEEALCHRKPPDYPGLCEADVCKAPILPRILQKKNPKACSPAPSWHFTLLPQITPLTTPPPCIAPTTSCVWISLRDVQILWAI